MDSQPAAESNPPQGHSAGLRAVRDLLDAYPGAAVAIIDPAAQLGDARGVLAASGIDIGAHTMLRGTALAEFVTPTDARLIGVIVDEASDFGKGMQTVHLRDGQEAALHLLRVDELHLATGYVMVIVPSAGGSVSETPAPNAVEPAVRVGVLYVDGSGIITRAEDSVISVLGVTRAEIEGTPLISLAHPDEQESAVVHWVAAKDQRGVPRRWRSRVRRGDGTYLWIEVTITNRIDDAGDGDVRMEFNDISREVAAAEALAAERSLLKQLTETLPVGVAKFDTHGRIEYSNAQLARLLGRDPASIVGAAVSGASSRLADAFSRVLRDAESSRFVLERGPDQPDRDLEWTLQPVTSPEGTVVGAVLCVADVSEATELRAALEERATTDALTGCLNWAGTINCLQSALGTASSNAGVGVLFIDLNGFKEINDLHGHAIGDRALELVATRLRHAVRPLDQIGRLGGDEFVVVAPGLASLEATRALAGRVYTAVNRVAGILDLHVDISASIGVAWADSGDADVLLAEADRAMYMVKSALPTR